MVGIWESASEYLNFVVEESARLRTGGMGTSFSVDIWTVASDFSNACLCAPLEPVERKDCGRLLTTRNEGFEMMGRMLLLGEGSVSSPGRVDRDIV